MNTILSASRVALVAFALGTAGVTATFAQTTTPTTTPSTDSTPPPASYGGHHHHGGASVLTDAEKAQLKKAKETALASNGTLKTEEANLKQQRESLKSSNAPKAQWTSYHDQKEAFRKDLRTAELAADPTLGPIFAKLDAAHKGGRHSQS